MARSFSLLCCLLVSLALFGCSSSDETGGDVDIAEPDAGPSLEDTSGAEEDDATVADDSGPADVEDDTAEPDVFDFESRCDEPPSFSPDEMPELVEPPVPHEEYEEELMGEHMGMLDLVSYDDVTHVAINDGYWCNPATWHNGEVPTADARVVIMEGVTVEYDIIDDETSLFSIRVDGTLEFSPDVSSTMVFDTMVVDQRGTLTIGTEDHPVGEDVEIRLVVADNGDIDVSWDTMLMSRGLLSHGDATIHGQPKTTHLKVSDDAMAGDTQLVLIEEPKNWEVGDTIVLTGTHYSGWKWDNDVHEVLYHGTQDEVRTITSVDGANIGFEEPLEYDHPTPREDLKASVANMTRNIVFETENGDELAAHQRGHVMFMHSHAIDVRYAEFTHLGRTDKSEPARAVEIVEDVEADSNVQGRYSMHFHRTGIGTQQHPALAIGNAVFNAPGWGYVHHDSHAIFDDNASFDTFGAGFVAETGNETGLWSNNIAIKAKGSSSFNPKNGVDNEIFDMARTGAGFWFQGRLVRAVDNIAASVNHGHVYFHRGDGMLRFDARHFTLPEALGLDPSARANHPPIMVFHGNEAFATTVGLFVVKANPNQRHDIRSIMKDFTAWSVRAGADLEYTSHYTLKDFDLIGQEDEPFRSAATGINFGTNTSDMVINRTTIEGFETGIELGKNFTNDDIPPETNQYVVIDAEFIDVEEEYEQLDTSLDQIMTSDDLEPHRFEVTIDDRDSLSYCSTYTDGCRETPFVGLKTDSIGDIPIPSGTDAMGVRNRSEMIRILEHKGYYEDGDETNYVIVETHFSDRATGEIHQLAIPVELDEDVPLHSEYHPYEHALENGAIDFDNTPPTTNDKAVSTSKETEITIDGLAEAHDPEGDDLRVAGIVQPVYGQVFRDSDATLTYQPDFGFTGEDRFKYWVSDQQGNFTPTSVDIEVVD